MKRRTVYVIGFGIAMSLGAGLAVGGLVIADVFPTTSGSPQPSTDTPASQSTVQTATPTSGSDDSIEIKSPEPVSTPGPEIAFYSQRSQSGEGYYVEAGVNTWGAADSIIIKYQGEEVERIASGETEVIASGTSSNTLNPLPEGAELVAYARDGGSQTEIFRWEVELGGGSNV
ncbi:hypothetical protein [Haloarcula argentinensis]|uniref:Uncharacterized protein n=1 Tax=Haloarcula argentinensis TaxID=43776 RepID=A0ABU2F2D0_HALAR|nr:hypothetical protein [Haloarcula argentinensis]MDS0254704.1 hypothetical protein [Haloarcula argentinensis]